MISMTGADERHESSTVSPCVNFTGEGYPCLPDNAQGDARPMSPPLAEAPCCCLGIVMINLNTDSWVAQSLGRYERRSGAEEGVQHDPTINTVEPYATLR